MILIFELLNYPLNLLISDWEKTSLKPYVEMFQEHIRGLTIERSRTKPLGQFVISNLLVYDLSLNVYTHVGAASLVF